MWSFLYRQPLTRHSMIFCLSVPGWQFNTNKYFRLELDPIQICSWCTWISQQSWSLSRLQQFCDKQRGSGARYCWLPSKYIIVGFYWKVYDLSISPSWYPFLVLTCDMWSNLFLSKRCQNFVAKESICSSVLCCCLESPDAARLRYFLKEKQMNRFLSASSVRLYSYWRNGPGIKWK